MTVSSQGLITWQPPTGTASNTRVTLRVYDTRGGYATQGFNLQVQGANRSPILSPLPSQINGREGQLIELPIGATDPDSDRLLFWINNLPPGAVFDPETRLFTWTPDATAAGTYENVQFVVSDGKQQVSQSVTFAIAPTNQAPTLINPGNAYGGQSQRSIRQGETFILRLAATDPDGQTLTYFSNILPAGATINPVTGVFEWTPGYNQTGIFRIPFSVSDGQLTSTQTVNIEILDVNAAPVFDTIGRLQVQEGQQLRFRVFALDPDNPGYIPQERRDDGTLTPLEGTEATIEYEAVNLPTGADFDEDTGIFTWTPGFNAATQTYSVKFIAKEIGNGLTSEMIVPITVLNTNRRPVVTLKTADGQSVNINQAIALTRNQSRTLVFEATDADGDTLALTARDSRGRVFPGFANFIDLGIVDGKRRGELILNPNFSDRPEDYLFTLSAAEVNNGLNNLTEAVNFTVSLLTYMSPIGDKAVKVGSNLNLEIPVIAPTNISLDYTWELSSSLPPGASFTTSADKQTGIFNWTPNTAGSTAITLTLKHPNGQVLDTQTFTINARTADNLAPSFSPINLTATEGQLLDVFLGELLSNPDGDALTYTISNLPAGAILNPFTGRLQWTPSFASTREVPLQLTITDGSNTFTGALKITVADVNQQPILLPLPPQQIREGAPLQFTLVGADGDNDPLNYTVVSQLPTGAVFDATTRQFRWTPGFGQAGKYTLTFAAIDSQQARGTVDVEINVENVNRPPSFKDLFNRTAVVGKTLEFTLEGEDPDSGTTLTYQAERLPQGAIFNSISRKFTWQPTPGQLGDYTVVFNVSDGETTTTQTILIRSLPTSTDLPIQVVVTPGFPAIPKQQVLIQASVDSLAGVAREDLVIKVNGNPINSQALGRAVYVPDAPGTYTIEVTATDRDGLTGKATAILKVRDNNDTTAPVVVLDPELAGLKIINTKQIIGAIADTNLDTWQVELAPFNSNNFVTLAKGNQQQQNTTLATINPETLANGFYRLRLTAADIGGRTSQQEVIIEINSANKLQSPITSTDLAQISLGGVNVNLVRVYDALNVDKFGSFGYGWSLSNIDTNLQVNVPVTNREEFGNYNPFKFGTRLYLNLPDGTRGGFTFRPQEQDIAGVKYYKPVWVADNGVNYTLASTDTLLIRASDRFYEINSGQPYNPANPALRGTAYTLTAANGTIYKLDGRGRITEQITDGKRLFFSDSGIISSTGETVRFVRDAAGRIAQITDPNGREVIYQYDDNGALVNVRQLYTGTSSRYGYSLTRPHELIAIAQPDTDLGTAYHFNNAPATSGEITAAGEVDQFTFTIRNSELRSTESGLVLVGIEIKATSGNLKLAAPTINGLTPLSTPRIFADGKRVYALYAIDREALYAINIQGADNTTGAYSLKLFIAGDVTGSNNSLDETVDGRDYQALLNALGTTNNDIRNNLRYDLDASGEVDAADLEILGRNFGFVANTPPQVRNLPEILTHTNLEVTVPLSDWVTDNEGDTIYFRTDAFNRGTIRLSPDGKSIIFAPEPNFSAPTGASFSFIADDGFNAATSGAIAVEVSNEPLQRIRFGQRQIQLEPNNSQRLQFFGDFADQENVALPFSYLNLNVENSAIATLNEGIITTLSQGVTTIQASKNGISAITNLVSGFPRTRNQQLLLVQGIDPLPDSVLLSGIGATQQLKVLFGETDLTTATQGTRYFSSNPNVIQVEENGQIIAKGLGK
jgi:YD repeat-containing protein